MLFKRLSLVVGTIWIYSLYVENSLVLDSLLCEWASLPMLAYELVKYNISLNKTEDECSGLFAEHGSPGAVEITFFFACELWYWHNQGWIQSFYGSVK